MSTSANLFLCQLMSKRKKAHILPKPLDVMLVPCHSPILAFHLAQLSPPFWISVLWLQRLKGDFQGRLIVVNSVFSALPTFYMCCLQLPPTVINQIDRYQKHCLWSGGDINRKGSCLAAWDIACRTKEEGGLGIVNMKSQNVALLIKYMDKFYNHADIPWVSLTWSKLYSNNSTHPHARSPIGSFWWKDIMKLMDKFLLMAKCNTSKDNSVLFWHDNWLQDTVKSSFPQLYSFTKKPKCSLWFFVDQNLDRLFHLPLSIQASNQLTDLQAVLQEGVWDPEEDDYWVYSWGSNTYNSRKCWI